MFEKYTDSARSVMSYMSSVAAMGKAEKVDATHMLLALSAVRSPAQKIMSDLGVGYDKISGIVHDYTKDDIPPSEYANHSIPFDDEVKPILEDTMRFVLNSNHSFVSPLDILRSMVSGKPNRAVGVLMDLGASMDDIINAVDRQQEPPSAGAAPHRGNTPRRAPEPPSAPSVPNGPTPRETVTSWRVSAPKPDSSPIAQYGRNLTTMAQEGRLDPVIDRKVEIDRLMRTLVRRSKNNPVILGEAGVGKTAIVEGLAQLIASGNAPVSLRNKQIYTIDLGTLVAGTQYRGQFEERLRSIIDDVANDQNKILFIDELHTLIGAGNGDGGLDASAMLKPALARGELQLIGATTSDEYRKRIEKDSAFARRFQPILIGEPSVDETVSILMGLKGRYEEHHRVRYSDEAVAAAVTLSDRYIQDRFLPDKAIDVLDEAGAKCQMEGMQVPDAIAKLDEEIAELRRQESDAAGAQHYEDAAQIRDKIKMATEKRDAAEHDWLESLEDFVGTVTEEDVASVVSEMSGVPVSNLSEAESKKLLRCEDVLHERVIGQDNAVSSVAKAIRRSRSPLKDPRRPGGSFIFVGPSGVGKTELAKSLAEFLFGSENALISFDMSEYMEKFNVSKLIGAPPGYVGYDEGGELTKAVRQKPYSVVLFDEIEKAHPSVFDVLLQVLDEGHLTDGQGRVVDFSNTVIIMTSNAGTRDLASASPMGFITTAQGAISESDIKDKTEKELKRIFRPEFLNRIDEVVTFQPLTDSQLKQIVALLVKSLQERLDANGLSIEMTDAAYDLLVKKGTDPVYGARPLRRAIQTMIEDPLAEILLLGDWKDGDTFVVDVDGNEAAPQITLRKKARRSRKKRSTASKSTGKDKASKPAKPRGRKKTGSDIPSETDVE